MPATLADIQRKYGGAVFPLYKDQMHEPYMEAKNGVGYQGVILYDEIEDKVQCQVCGEWFKSLGSHIQKHEITPADYRERVGLKSSTPLCAMETSKKLSETIDDNIPFITRVGRPVGSKTVKRRKKSLVSTITLNNLTMQAKNEVGLCPAQIAARLMIVSASIGKDVNELNDQDIKKYDKTLLEGIRKKYANVAQICRGMAKESGRKYKDALLLSRMRDFVRTYHFIPKFKHIDKCGLGMGSIETSRDLYRRLFGSWFKAIEEAGLYQLLTEVGGKRGYSRKEFYQEYLPKIEYNLLTEVKNGQ